MSEFWLTTLVIGVVFVAPMMGYDELQKGRAGDPAALAEDVPGAIAVSALFALFMAVFLAIGYVMVQGVIHMAFE